MLPVVGCRTDLDGPCYLSLAVVQIFLVYVTCQWLSYRFSWFMLPVVGCRTDFLGLCYLSLAVVQIFLVYVTCRWLSYRFSWFMLPVVGCRTDFSWFMLPVVGCRTDFLGLCYLSLAVVQISWYLLPMIPVISCLTNFLVLGGPILSSISYCEYYLVVGCLCSL